MKALLQWAAIVFVVVAALVFASRPEDDTGSGAASSDAIAASLRCPVCQGMSVKDSDSPTARDMRADIDRRLAAGETAAEIRQAYVDRYSEWILLRPDTQGIVSLVWIVPVAAGAAGAVTIGGAMWRWRRNPSRRPPSPAERELVDAALAHHRHDSTSEP